MILPQTRGSEFASYLTRFSINAPVNGLYEVKAVLSQGGKSAEASTTFEVTGGQPSGDTEIASVLDAQLPLIPPDLWPSPFRPTRSSALWCRRSTQSSRMRPNTQ